MSDNVFSFFKPEKPDMVFICQECDCQTFKLLEDGRIKCDNCNTKLLAPLPWFEKSKTWNNSDDE